jgi:hypothetical protein
VSAVIADLTTNYAVDETMMLFPDKNKKSRQMRLYEQLNLKDSMPLVGSETDIFSHECAAAFPDSRQNPPVKCRAHLVQDVYVLP